MDSAVPTLYYVHDPMCSWCWGFRPVWHEVQNVLAAEVKVQYLLGGLAPDTQELMSESMQATIRATWQRIQREIPGTVFNYDFWSSCRPRRSTYPSCRAILACRMQRPDLEHDMLLAIQQAYYLRAKNPSDTAVLVQLAEDLGLDVSRFSRDINSDECIKLFVNELSITRMLYVSSFPSLVLSTAGSNTSIDIDYSNSDNVIQQIMLKLHAIA